MADNMTRGGLVAASIKNLYKPDEIVYFMFNPFEYSLSKTNSWKSREGIGVDLSYVDFQKGAPQTLNLTLHFDSQAAKTDVRSYTRPLWTMMMVDENKINQTTGKGQPPPVFFEWGKLYFQAIITRMTEKITLFSETGIPLRCSVEIALQEYINDSATQPQIPQHQGVRQAPTTTTATQGDRLDNIAAQNGGDPAMQRQIATDNNIDNPMNVPTGTRLRVNR
jgi:hypothetical protein